MSEENSESEKQIIQNAFEALATLRASIGCDGLLLPENQLAAVVVCLEAYLHMHTEEDT